jgi:hypothetical protein
MSEKATTSPAQPAVVLGLTFLLIGLTFALPFQLVPVTEPSVMSGPVAPEATNVYAVVAWAGWAHFLFAFRGQGNALAKVHDAFRNGRLVAYIATLSSTILVLLGCRAVMGVPVFGALVWVYFIDHFMKAERVFEGKTGPIPILARWLTSYQPLLTFGWLSIVLMNVGDINSNSWALWTVSSFLGAVVLVFGGFQRMMEGDSRGPLLSLFFVGEALVWGAVSRSGGQVFLTGVYVFHIAAGSYVHYLGSYFVANAKSKARDKLVTPVATLAVNLAIIVIGILVAQKPSLAWLNPILGVQWFTLWVGVHLVMSDLFPAIKTWRMARNAHLVG